MSTITVTDVPLEPASPGQRLRRVAAAVRVHFTWWGVRRALTSPQKQELGEAYNADVSLLSAGKKIIDVRHEAFRRLTSIRTRIINYWRGLTLPYVEAGVRLIRQADIEAFVHTLEGFRDELTEGEVALDGVYDQIKSDARRRLGSLYDDADYPPQVRGLFRVDWDFPAIEPPGYLMRLSPELYQQEQERITHRFDEAVRLAEQAFVGEFARLVSHLTERLADGEDGRRQVFRDSMVENLTGFFERFRRLNIRSNQDLDQLVAQAQQLVQGVTPQELRDDAALRQHVAATMTQVQNQLEGMIVERPRRQILRAQPPTRGGERADDH
jgi:hypothetical protein